MRANPQAFMDNGRLRPNYPGKFVGVERLVRATQWSEPIDQPNLGGVARIFAPQGGAPMNSPENRAIQDLQSAKAAPPWFSGVVAG